MSLDWRVQHAGLTLFSSEQITVSDKDWQAITGQEEAETRQTIPGARSLSGKVLNGLLNVGASGARADVILNAAVEIDHSTEKRTLPVIGSIDDALTTFFESTSKWAAEMRHPIVRVAVGAILLSGADNQEQAYQQLAELLLSVKVDPKRMQDLQYRVNWRCESKIEKGLLINRLTTWSAMHIFRRLVQIVGTDVTTEDQAGKLTAVRLEIDNNTDDSRKAPFDQAQLVPIYSELLDLARENAAKGEVL
jgi:hypothetical protein